ncbi:hypothetical protein DWS34_23550 [Bacteroides fragilis]|nr:hypothetical protein DWS34_23550 [Bacteroides fragilis]
MDKAKLMLCINEQLIGDWFKKQFEKLRQNICQPVQPQRKSKVSNYNYFILLKNNKNAVHHST